MHVPRTFPAGQSRQLIFAAALLVVAIGLSLLSRYGANKQPAEAASRGANGRIGAVTPSGEGLPQPGAVGPRTQELGLAASQASTTEPADASSPALVFRDSQDTLGLLGKPASDASKMLWQSLATVIVIGVLLWAGLKLFKKLAPGVAAARGKNISVQETLFLAPGKSVHLLKVGKRLLLLAGSRDRLSLLADVTGALPSEFATTRSNIP